MKKIIVTDEMLKKREQLLKKERVNSIERNLKRLERVRERAATELKSIENEILYQQKRLSELKEEISSWFESPFK